MFGEPSFLYTDNYMDEKKCQIDIEDTGNTVVEEVVNLDQSQQINMLSGQTHHHFRCFIREKNHEFYFFGA